MLSEEQAAGKLLWCLLLAGSQALLSKSHVVVRGARPSAWQKSWLMVTHTVMGRGPQGTCRHAGGTRGAMSHSEVSVGWRYGWWWSCSVLWTCRRQLVASWWAAETVMCLAVRRVRAGARTLSDAACLYQEAHCCWPHDDRPPVMHFSSQAGHVQQDGAFLQLQLHLLHVLIVDSLLKR